MLRLLFTLPLLASCVLTTDAPAQVVLGSSSTGALDESTGTTLAPVMTSTDAGSTSSAETTGDGSTSSSGDASSTSSGSTGEGSTSTTGEALPDCRDGDPDATCKVFVSSGLTPPNLLAAGFHSLCTELACLDSGTECVKYRAIIRESGDFWAPYAGFTGTYTLLDGSVIAEGGALQDALPITLTEAGSVVPNKSLVWTGHESLFWTCAVGPTPWATVAANNFTQVGHAGGDGLTKWDAEQVDCNTLARVYCVEVPAE